MYLCVLDQAGAVVFDGNLLASPEAFRQALAPFRTDLVVCCECIFAWYWLADLCAVEQIPFVLGHALYRKAIHGGKAKNDRLDAHKIATLLRGGMPRPTRRNGFGPAADRGPRAPRDRKAETAEVNRSGVSSAIPGFVPLQTLN